jgi:hypothetical protein
MKAFTDLQKQLKIPLEVDKLLPTLSNVLIMYENLSTAVETLSEVS